MKPFTLAILALFATQAFARGAGQSLTQSDYTVQMKSPTQAYVLNNAPAIVSELRCDSRITAKGQYEIHCPKTSKSEAEFTAVLDYDSAGGQWGGAPDSAELKFNDSTTYKMACSAGATLTHQPTFDLFTCN